MSHLGDRLSALVDGELSHDERDRLHTHLAACHDCRREAAELRALKRRVGALGDTAMDARLLARLLAIAEPGEPVPARSRRVHGSAEPRPALRMYPDVRPHGGRARGGAHRPATGPAQGDGAPRGPSWPGRPGGRRRASYVVASVVSFLIVGVGGLSFVAGGGQGAPGPRITPQVEMFTVQHSVTTGELPLANPAATLVPASPAPRGGP
jgi:anti-sigma factor RsiW